MLYHTHLKFARIVCAPRSKKSARGSAKPYGMTDKQRAPAAGVATHLPRSSAPEAQGIASSAVLAFVEAADRNLRELHSFMLLRHGQVVAEGWWSPYGPQDPHMLFSLSKSFTATAAGLAIAEGLLSLEDAVLPFFPDDAPAAQPSHNLAAMRLRHLLSMSTGHTLPSLRARNAPSVSCWAAAFLEQPVEHAPGTHFIYNSGATYMISAIIQKVTGTTVQEYLRPRLFAPLGIRADVPWENCPRGINTGGWGLSLRTEDIARFGQLYLQDGVWNGQRLLPEGWVTERTNPPPRRSASRETACRPAFGRAGPSPIGHGFRYLIASFTTHHQSFHFFD